MVHTIIEHMLVSQQNESHREVDRGHIFYWASLVDEAD